MARKYFSQRSGNIPDNISLADFASRFNIIFNNFVKERYFKEMGIINQDSDSVRMSDLGKLKEKLFLAFGPNSKKMVPIPENIMKLDRDSLFDLIELLADHVSEHKTSTLSDDVFSLLAPDRFTRRPRKIHTTHFDSYDNENGRKKWRDVLNEYLIQLDPPSRLTNEQNIEILPTSEGLRHLVDNCASPSEESGKKIKHAQGLFLKHGATEDDKRSALKDLADVLEFMRREIKIIPTEENELFNIANNYGIRHYKPDQKTGYDENYLQWIFYSYLAAIDLVTKLRTRKL